jgi:putative heme-binding domain-containing protein
LAPADRESADTTLTRLAARLGNRAALKRSGAIAASVHAAMPIRLAMIELLGELHDPASGRLLLDVATRGDAISGEVQSRALAALAHFDGEWIGREILAEYPRQGPSWRSHARELLFGRVAWARAYLAELDSGRLTAADVTLEELARFPVLLAPDLAAQVRKHWGTTRGATPEERLAEVRRLNNDLRAGVGDGSRGRLLFQDRCAACHRLDRTGQTIGPDLTHANRRDRDFLLTSLVDPSGVVRKEYQASVVATRDGRVLSGLIVEQSPETIVLCNSRAERTRIARSEIEDVRASDVSLMPETLYKDLSPDQLRDLFRFLQSEPTPSTERSRHDPPNSNPGSTRVPRRTDGGGEGR